MPHSLDEFTFILVDRKPVQHPNDEKWFAWYCKEENRRVAKTDIGDVHVSTVFISIDLTPQRGMLFETKIFGGSRDGQDWRAATWEDAEKKHAEVVELVRSDQPKSQ